MKLTVNWHRATRDETVRKRVEEDYSERLTDLFGNVDLAYKSREDWHQQGEPVFHPWVTYNDIAFDEVTRFMMPCERKLIHIAVGFE